MKMLKYLLYVTFLALMVSACGNEDNENIGKGENINSFKLTSPSNFSDVVLNPATLDKEITFRWEAAKPGLGGTVTYRFLLDKVDGNFSAPLLSIPSDNDGKDAHVNITAQELKAAVSAVSGDDFIWTIEATTVKDNGSNTVRASNSFSVTIQVSDIGISEFTYIAPSANQKLSLDNIRKPNDEIVFSWTAATSDEANVTYTWLASTTPEGFDNPVLEVDSDDEGTATTLTLTHSELITALNGITYVDGLYWRVNAVANGFEYSPDTRFVWFDIYNIPNLYVVGSFTNNWTNNCTDAITLTNKGGGVFEYLIDIPAMAEFKFVLECGSWDTTFGSPTDDAVDPSTEYEMISPGKNVKVTEAGKYVVQANFNTGKFKLTQLVIPDNLYLVGGATTAGWDPSKSIPFVKTGDGQFEIYAHLNADGFKFLQVMDWLGDWGMGDEGKLVQEGENNVTVATAGFYRITVDFINLTYSVQSMNFGIVGSARTGDDGGWGADDDMTFVGGGEGNDYRWTITKTLFNGLLKFRANDDWPVNFGDNGANGTLEYGGDNISITAGTYKIDMVLDPVNGYTYTITPQ